MASTTSTPEPRSRRAILAGAVGGLAAAIAAGLGSPVRTIAAHLPGFGHGNNAGTADTSLTTSSAGSALLVTQNGSGTALRGSAVGAGSIAGFFTAANGTGISGVTAAGGRYGIFAQNNGAAGTAGALRASGGANHGVVATTAAAGRYAVTAVNQSLGENCIGIYGESVSSVNSAGVRGIGFNGVVGSSTLPGGSGVVGTGSHDVVGAFGVSGHGSGISTGVRGTSDTGHGVFGHSTDSVGVFGLSHSYYGVFAQSETGISLYVDAPTTSPSTSLFVLGNGEVTGDFSVTGLKVTGIRVATPAATQVLVASSTIGVTSEITQISSTAPRTLTSTPTIAAGADGELVMLVNVGNEAITVQDESALAGSNLRLSAAALSLDRGDSLKLVYATGIGDWLEVGHTSLV